MIFRHLNQIQEMADGNFQLNAFAKNNDPEDVSLETANGIGYFSGEISLISISRVLRRIRRYVFLV